MGVARWVGDGSEQQGGEVQHGSSSVPARVRLVTVREDATIGNEHLLRGIPVAGVGGGAISGTRPGDSSLRIERDEAHLVVGRLRRTRRRDHQGGQA